MDVTQNEVKTPINSYSKIHTLGHRLIKDLFSGTVVVEEKVDGSQFSFKRDGDQVHFRSRGATIYPETADKLFKAAVDYIVSIKATLVDGYTYRGEVLHAPRHNTLLYERVPRHNVVIFDVFDPSIGTYLAPDVKIFAAGQLDLEVVPAFFHGKIESIEQLRALLETQSFLGGAKIEGIVIKNYDKYGEDDKPLMGKWVREEFKEQHSGEWKRNNPSKGDVIESLIATYRNENRWNKAIQHLRDAGLLKGEPQDIGPLIKEFQKDLLEECADEIKEQLYKLAAPKIMRGASYGLPEYYKSLLAQQQFPEPPVEPEKSIWTVIKV